MARVNRLDAKDLQAKRPNIIGRTINEVLTMLSEVNKPILICVLILSCLGIAAVYSAGYYQTVASGNTTYYLIRHSIFVFAGFIIMLLVACVDYHKYNRVALFLLILSLVMLVYVLGFGSSSHGATRWISLGGFFNITPSELSKVFVVIYTSVFLAADPRRARGKYIVYLLAIMGAHALLIIKQPNLSTAVVLCAIMLGIMFVAGMNPGWMASMGAVGVGGIYLILNYFQDTHWYTRLTNWIDPFAVAQGSGYQVSQSLIALGNGGLTGVGIGKSITKTLYLPEPMNDFILAIIGEEVGYLGILILMAIYIVLFYHCIMTAARAKDKLGFYLASGVSIMLALQVIINVAVVTASMPATGITLPLISYGGTSVLVFMFAFGIVLNISRTQGKNAKEE